MKAFKKIIKKKNKLKVKSRPQPQKDNLPEKLDFVVFLRFQMKVKEAWYDYENWPV